MEQLFSKLIASISDPVSLVLLLWLWYMIRDRGDLIEINAKLLEAQQQRGITLTNITAMLDARLPSAKGLNDEMAQEIFQTSK